MQSHLIGVPELLIGRHENGILRRTEPLRVADIPSKVVIYGKPWNPQVEIDHGYTILTTIKKLCLEQAANNRGSHDSPNERVWRVDVREQLPLNIRELTVDEIDGLASEDDLEKRVGIIPLSIANEIRTSENTK